LAQASQSGAAIWLMEETASRVISDKAIDDIGPVTLAISHQHVVTTTKIVHCGIDFKGAQRALSSRPEPLKDYLIGVAGGALALFGGPHRPGQQRQSKNMARDPGGK
jgi:hypothetical protein